MILIRDVRSLGVFVPSIPDRRPLPLPALLLLRWAERSRSSWEEEEGEDDERYVSSRAWLTFWSGACPRSKFDLSNQC